ncbi:transposase (fragment) [Magnetospirillum gryphiswaldense MSR-1 v2]|uniref:Transposase n=1 Tax=Magnetospirillum gryphiswaldense (strain DSM 6361 / JCM 21280 / NBRC 15271 / MSR-1) TaxID=431944 RepID=V6F5G3_MAGGM
MRQKDRDTRWTVKYSKAKPREDGQPQVDLAVPSLGYKNHVPADLAHGLIRKWLVTDAAAHDGARLPDLLDKTNTASGVWADTAYRSEKNETFMAKNGFVSQVHRKKPKGKPMPDRTRKANALKSMVRYIFAHQKGPMAAIVRTIGKARAETKIGMINLAYNMLRLMWLERKRAPA